MSEIAAFNPNQFQDKVRDRIRAAFVELIPEDQWNALVQKEIDAFLTTREERVSGYSYETRVVVRPSALRQAVWDVLAEEAKKRARVMLDSPEWQSMWNGEREVLGESLAKFVEEAAPVLLKSMFTNAVQTAVASLRSQL